MQSSLWRVGEEEVRYIREAIEGGLSGRFNTLLEDTFAQKIGTEYAIGVNSGTSALHCALWAAGVGEGDEVIVPPITFAAPAMAVLQAGGTPVFADVDPKTFTVDPEDVHRKITNATKAIVPVALYGVTADLDPILDAAQQRGIAVIEDNAQCYLGKYKGRTAGTIGDAAIYSFERSKHITCGNGGIVVTNNEALAERIRKFSVLGYASLSAKKASYKSDKDIIQHPSFKRHQYIGFNYRLPEICAAMLLAQVEKLDKFVELRRQIGKVYADAVAECSWLYPQYVPDGYTTSCWTYVMALAHDVPWEDFRRVFRELGGDRYYGAWGVNYLEPAFKDIRKADGSPMYSEGLCPVAEDLQPRLIQLKTNYCGMEQAEVQAEILRNTIVILSGSGSLVRC